MEEDTSSDSDVDPIADIAEYLIRCTKVSFKNAHLNQKELRTADKIKLACDLFKLAPIDFLEQFGVHLTPHHMDYFENFSSSIEADNRRYQECIRKLKIYHSSENRHKRIRNRRYKALLKLKEETDYFSDKQMMFRNPLLYEQLVGQYLTDDEIRERDGVDSENLTFLSLILDTVDRNKLREIKNEQMLEENIATVSLDLHDEKLTSNNQNPRKKCQWGDFETPDTTPSFRPETRKQSLISAPERQLLYQEFVQEMYSSFIDGRDVDVDYYDIDNNEQFDDLQQVSQDAEDRYFDSEQNDITSLEEHMALVKEYGSRNTCDATGSDPLDEFMQHLNKQNKK